MFKLNYLDCNYRLRLKCGSVKLGKHFFPPLLYRDMPLVWKKRRVSVTSVSLTHEAKELELRDRREAEQAQPPKKQQT